MRNSVLLLLLITSVAAFGFVIYPNSNDTNIDEEVKINWMSFEEAVEASKKEKKKIFIDVYTDWCGWCKVMDKNTFSKNEIATYVNEHFYAVKFNAEQKEPITFNNYEYKFVPSGRRGYHELAATLFQAGGQKSMSYPTTIYMDENFRVIQAQPGYLKPDQLMKILDHVAMNKYLPKSQQPEKVTETDVAN